MVRSQKNASEASNLVVLSGRILKDPKYGFTVNRKMYLQFVLENTKPGGFNFIPCAAWEDVAKKLTHLKGNDFVKLSGRINTFSENNQSKFQVLIVDAEKIDV